MSVTNVRAAIERFLAYDKPQVLCIRGAWGTGKTYTWDEVLKKTAADKKIKAKKYAKASLFGLNSIKELKREVFQSAIDIDQIGKPFDIENVTSVVDNLKSWSKWALNKASFVHEDAMTAAIEVAALFAREQLILIDDLERKGEDLRSVDVLGYISQLRDDRSSKVVLLLNDEELEDQPEFTSYLEKVVDVYLRFEPTCEEIAGIAIQETVKVSVLVRQDAIALGITNVRIIRKIHALVKDLVPFIDEYAEIVTVNAAAVITLLGWSHFQPKTAPPLDYLKRVHTYSPKQDDVDFDMKWRDLLLKYRYTHTSEFDLVLLKGIENGYFDKAAIEKHAAELDRAEEKNKAEQEVRAIWDEMHYSFTKPAQGILDKFFECYMRNIEFMTLGDMAIFERLFRELGDDRSEQLVDRYIAANKTKPGAFDFERLERFGDELTGPVKEKIAVAEAEQAPKVNPDEVLIALGTRGYEEELYDVAAKLPVSEFVRILKSYEGSKLSDIISGLRQYLNTGGLDPRIHTIMDKAGLALRQIAEESPINKRRAMRLGLIQRLDAKEAKAAGTATNQEQAGVQA
ncbi:hypothetical protein SO078_30405 (plasmid) [Sinorhizobium meliloti]|uniref:hypothetical protein n=1 Tax=Rhizobium meliloti TaxID=382 RepID=UPI002D789FAB|nr:hypothetical protein [Sinorhizobium meliloti]WRQ72091.1 hypothetical protein SO078_30405 [Sinorhizobium meliloti]